MSTVKITVFNKSNTVHHRVWHEVIFAEKRKCFLMFKTSFKGIVLSEIQRGVIFVDMKDKVEKELAKINDETKDEILANFNQFKEYLAEKVELGEKMGLSEEKLAKTTELIANFLAKHEEPRNREEHVLLELWKSGTKEEQHALAHMLLKMVRGSS